MNTTTRAPEQAGFAPTQGEAIADAIRDGRRDRTDVVTLRWGLGAMLVLGMAATGWLASGIDSNRDRIEANGERLTRVEHRLDAVEERLDAVDEKLAALDGKLDRVLDLLAAGRR